MSDGLDLAKATRAYTTKQMGDACEMLVAAELTLAGIPALKVPDNWPHYDVIAQPLDGAPKLISVKARTYKAGSNFVNFWHDGGFDWLAAVILKGPEEREIYLIPRTVFEARATKAGPEAKRPEWYCRIDQMQKTFPEYLNNFRLLPAGLPGPHADTLGQARM